jgi:hypothetical protein
VGPEVPEMTFFWNQVSVNPETTRNKTDNRKKK